jgi:hypothetical protein
MHALPEGMPELKRQWEDIGVKSTFNLGQGALSLVRWSREGFHWSVSPGSSVIVPLVQGRLSLARISREGCDGPLVPR